MRWVPTFAAALSLVVAVAAPAWAISGSLGLDPAASSASATLSNTFASASAPATLSGSLEAEVSLGSDPGAGSYADSLTILGRLALADLMLRIESPGLTDITATAIGVEAGLDAGPLTGTPTGPGGSTFMLPAGAVVLDQGVFTMTGSVLHNVVDVSLDLSVSPLALGAAEASARTLVLPDGSADVELTLPIDVVLIVPAGGFENRLALTGEAVLTGTLVPEPATGLLLAVGIAASARAARRRPPGDFG